MCLRRRWGCTCRIGVGPWLLSVCVLAVLAAGPVPGWGDPPPDPFLFEEGRWAHARGDYLGAVRRWLPLARGGHVEAQYALGLMFFAGEGTPQDDVEAEKWFRRAADRGLVNAQYQLGSLYESGRGVPLDLESAHMWYNIAAGHANASPTRDEAARRRDTIGRRLTSTQVTRAQRMAREWRPGQEAVAAQAALVVRQASQPVSPNPAAVKTARVYLRYGAPIDVESWRLQGELLFYVHGGVTHGVPKGDVARIDDDQGRPLLVGADTEVRGPSPGAAVSSAVTPGGNRGPRRAVLHFRYGFTLDVDDWWGDAELLSYERRGVVHHVTRADVVQIEERIVSPPAARPAPSSAPSAPPAPAARPRAEPTPAAPRASAPPAGVRGTDDNRPVQGASPRPAATADAGAAEVLRVLKGLHSVTSGKVDYPTYAPRVRDARGHVDRYLQRPASGENEMRRLLAEAIDLYDLASVAWNAKIVDRLESYEVAGEDPVLERCSKLAIGTMLRMTSLGRGLSLSFGGIPALWSCAADRIVEAERLLRR